MYFVIMKRKVLIIYKKFFKNCQNLVEMLRSNFFPIKRIIKIFHIKNFHSPFQFTFIKKILMNFYFRSDFLKCNKRSEMNFKIIFF